MPFKALVFTKDSQLAKNFAAAVAGLPLDWALVDDDHLPRPLVESEPFDLLLLDARRPITADLVRASRASEINRNAFVFLVGDGAAAAVTERGADLVLDLAIKVRDLGERIRDCMPQMQHERRVHARHEVSFPVTLLKCEQVFTATAQNLSAGGMAVRLAHDLRHHEVMIVRFRLPGAATDLNLYGKLAWRGAGDLAGIRFLAVAEEERSELARWLNAQPGGTGASAAAG